MTLFKVSETVMKELDYLSTEFVAKAIKTHIK